MSSHREAPEISKDPVADSTDLYAFMSPDVAGTVTLIANYIPLEAPDGGPNFYEFADDVLYAINIDNTGDGFPDIAYRFRFTTVNNIPGSFLYNDGPITSLTPPSPTSNWNRQQTYTVSRVDMPWNRWRNRGEIVLGSGLLSPPCNIGPLSTPNYTASGQCRRPLCRRGTVLGQGVRRAARRRLLRRPRCRVRPRRPARIRRRPRRGRGPRTDERHARRQLDGRRQRAHARVADTGRPAHAVEALGPGGSRCRHRRLDHGEPPAGARRTEMDMTGAKTSRAGRGPRCRDWVTH